MVQLLTRTIQYHQYYSTLSFLLVMEKNKGSNVELRFSNNGTVVQFLISIPKPVSVLLEATNKRKFTQPSHPKSGTPLQEHDTVSLHSAGC